VGDINAAKERVSQLADACAAVEAAARDKDAELRDLRAEKEHQSGSDVKRLEAEVDEVSNRQNSPAPLSLSLPQHVVLTLARWRCSGSHLPFCLL
jgi:hypothetical protein